MIRNTAQNWEIGATVKVGFLSLIVVAAVPTPKDGPPDTYLLRRADQMYTFTPIFGLEKISADDAQDMVESAQQAADALIARFGA